MAYELLKKGTRGIGFGIFAVVYSAFHVFYKSYPHGSPEKKEIEKAFNRLFLGNSRQPNPTSLENTE